MVVISLSPWLLALPLVLDALWSVCWRGCESLLPLASRLVLLPAERLASTLLDKQCTVPPMCRGREKREENGRRRNERREEKINASVAREVCTQYNAYVSSSLSLSLSLSLSPSVCDVRRAKTVFLSFFSSSSASFWMCIQTEEFSIWKTPRDENEDDDDEEEFHFC